MVTQYDRLAALEEKEYEKALASYNDLERQAKKRGRDRAYDDFVKANKERLAADENTEKQA